MRGLKHFSFVAGTIAFFIALQGFSPTEAAPLSKDRVDVLQLKSITKKRRHELTPLLSLGLNDSFVQVMTVGLGYTYHLTEGFAFELRGAYAFSSKKTLWKICEAVAQALCSSQRMVQHRSQSLIQR